LVIIVEKYGQLGNRLFSYSHLIANSIEYKYKLYNPSFEDYACYFQNTENQIFLKFNLNPKNKSKYKILILKSILRKINYTFLSFLVKFLKKINFIKSLFHEIIDDKTTNYSFKKEDFVLKANKKIIFICNQYYFRDFHSFWKYENDIKCYFQPAFSKLDSCKQKIRNYRKINNNIIGVHFRAGDYRTWLGGEYFIELSDYIEIIKKVNKIFNKKPLFIIFSNEKVSIDSDNIIFANGDLIEDLYCLSMCDYIIGGYSSFVYWASFFGKVPLLSMHLNSNLKKSIFSIDDFILLSNEIHGNFP